VRMRDDGPRAPPPRTQTIRAAMLEALRAAGELGGAMSAREFSQAAKVSERDVASHLEHLTRSRSAQGERVEVIPAACVGCGYVFRDRARLTAPGACPECRATRITAPRFRLSNG
jgi:predicted Zn-ribbon and HTH transcriptional regulator